MELKNGRPQPDGRQPREIRVYDFLDNIGVAYQRVDHEPAETMEACKAVDGVLGIEMCKNLFLCNRQKSKFYLLLMPAGKPFKTKELSAQINSARLSFAGEDSMAEYLDIHPGAVSVMGLMNDSENAVTLLIDSDLLNDEYIGCHPCVDEYIGCHPCVNTSSLKLKMSDVLNKFLPAVNHAYTAVRLIGE